jgi:methionyl-tRNA formyltransferase
MNETLILVHAAKHFDALASAVRKSCGDIKIIAVSSKEHLALLSDEELANGVMVCFSTGIIIPGEILAKLRKTPFNFHGAAPEFPGRDAHNWAVYKGVRQFGAVLHIMNEKIDNGEILDNVTFDVPEDITPMQLNMAASLWLYYIFKKNIRTLVLDNEHVKPNGVQWNGKTNKRQDMAALCEIKADTTEEEIALRTKAFNADTFANLYRKEGELIVKLAHTPKEPIFPDYMFAEQPELLGDAYFFGIMGAKKDAAKADELYKKAGL